MNTDTLSIPAPRRLRLATEFLLLFIGAPVLMKVCFGLYPLFPVLAGLGILSCLLLQITPGWRWRMLLRGPLLREWWLILLFAALTFAISAAIVLEVAPWRFLDMPESRPRVWLMIMVLYPLLSALPQEIIFRSLFFERYGALFPNRWTAIMVNGAAFGLGHLFYDNWVTWVMTGIGGAVMGWAYLRNRSFALAWVLHALAGQIIFTVGLGIYFYHGNVAG
ncbi:MAG: CPBP family intramembrane glutamic endopeptidase [Pikeienuella sp.]